MAKFRLDFGADVELLTQGELDESLRASEERVLAAARGVKHVRLPVMRGTPAGGALTLGQSSDPAQVRCGPDQGWSWMVTRISVYGLASGDSLGLYWGDVGGSRFVGVLTAGAPCWDASRSLLLHPGDHIVVSGTGLTATGQITVSGEAISAPAEMLYKLIGG